MAAPWAHLLMKIRLRLTIMTSTARGQGLLSTGCYQLATSHGCSQSGITPHNHHHTVAPLLHITSLITCHHSSQPSPTCHQPVHIRARPPLRIPLVGVLRSRLPLVTSLLPAVTSLLTNEFTCPQLEYRVHRHVHRRSSSY